jgi:hypothetical protein
MFWLLSVQTAAPTNWCNAFDVACRVIRYATCRYLLIPRMIMTLFGRHTLVVADCLASGQWRMPVARRREHVSRVAIIDLGSDTHDQE